MTAMNPQPGSPPPMGNFTVHNGFGSMPPRRPGAVTAAAVVLMVFAVLLAAVMAINGLSIASRFGDSSGLPIFGSLWTLALQLAVAVVMFVVAFLLRNGHDVARSIALAIMGAVTVTVITSTSTNLLLSTTGEYPTGIRAWDVVRLGVALLIVAASILVIALLSGPAVGTWFHERRQARHSSAFTGLAATTGAIRPDMLPLAVAGLATIIGTQLIGLMINFVQADYDNGLGIAFTAQSLIVSIIVIACAFIAAIAVYNGRESGRLLAILLGGAVLGSSLSALWGPLSMMWSGFQGWESWLNMVLSVVAGTAGLSVIIVLSRLATMDWFHSQRTGAATTPPAESPPPGTTPWIPDPATGDAGSPPSPWQRPDPPRPPGAGQS